MNLLHITMLSSYLMRGTAVFIDGKRVYFKKSGGEYRITVKRIKTALN